MKPTITGLDRKLATKPSRSSRPSRQGRRRRRCRQAMPKPGRARPGRPLGPEVLAELVRRADALERDPSTGDRWEDLRELPERKDGKRQIIFDARGGSGAAGATHLFWQQVCWRGPKTSGRCAPVAGPRFRVSALARRHAPKVRRAVLPRRSLGIFYRSTATFVLIAAVIDLRQDPAAIGRRLGLHEEPATFASQAAMTLPPGISFDADFKVRLPDRFNVAVPFIDRHLGEGRGAKAAIRTAQRDRHLRRARRAREPRGQCAAGARAEARRPAADGGEGLPGLLLSVLGRDQGRHRAGAAQHAAAGRRLRLHVRGFRAAGSSSIRASSRRRSSRR